MMKKKQIVAYYKQLRILILRAKEDADRWEKNQKPLLLEGIYETSVHDWFVYDRVYCKCVAQKKARRKEPNPSQPSIPKMEEKVERTAMEQAHSYTEIQLGRIADALERIADALNENKTEST